ncbi:MAG: hypothetical protein K2X87_00445 [Gemmataceae bacterium]|nr:hypothetical protein [Gemmataceae bacterium]
MRTSWAAAGVCGVVAAAVLSRSAADPPKEEPPRRIVPVVVLKPGETKELTLCAPCALMTRGGGLRVSGMGDAGEGKERTTWTKGGLTVSVPVMLEASAASRAPAYKPLADKGLSPFVVTVRAAADVKPGLTDLHVADETCSGTCETDFRVLVVAP